MVFVTAIQFCFCSMKAAINNIQMNGDDCSSKTLLKEVVGWVNPAGHTLLIHTLYYLGKN